MTLETILRKHFGCQRPVLKHPIKESDGFVSRQLTASGTRAYGRLISLLYALERLLPEQVQAEGIIKELDEIVDGFAYGLRESELGKEEEFDGAD